MRTRNLQIISSLLLTFVCSLAWAENEKDAQDLSLIQIGPEWTERLVDFNKLDTWPAARKKVALSIAAWRLGTVFYAGKFENRHLMITNAHVVVNNSKDLVSPSFSKWGVPCPESHDGIIFGNPSELHRPEGPDRRFTRAFQCQDVVGVWPEIDLAIFTIRVENDNDEAWLSDRGIEFGWTKSVMLDQTLFQVGYGHYGYHDGRNSEWQSYTPNWTADEECRVLSQNNEFRKIRDPDDFNTGPYSVWAFAMGCDAFWGDSGSPIVDRDSSQIIGVFFTAGTPKTPVAQDREKIRMWSNHTNAVQRPEVWKQLNYAIPVRKINDVISRDLGELSEKKPEFSPMVKAWLNSDRTESSSTQIRGNVVLWGPKDEAQLTEIDLPPFTEGKILENEKVKILLPSDFPIPQDSHLTFNLDDRNLAYVHTYIYATWLIETYNRWLTQIGQPTLPQFPFKIHWIDANQPIDQIGDGIFSSASANGGNPVKITTVAPDIDPTIIAHEIGHLVDNSLVGRTGSRSRSTPLTILGMEEPIANLFAALVMNEPCIGRYWYGDACFKVVNPDIHYPDRLPSGIDMIRNLVRSTHFSERHPQATLALKKVLSETGDRDDKGHSPDHYQVGAAFIGPIYELTRLRDNDEVATLFLRALQATPKSQQTVEQFMQNVFDIADKSSQSSLSSGWQTSGVWKK